MPHLSPMSWTLTVLSMWLIILSLTAYKFQMNPPSFNTGRTAKLLGQKHLWTWSLQGGRE